MLVVDLPNSLIRRRCYKSPSKGGKHSKRASASRKESKKILPAPPQTKAPPATMHTIEIHHRGLQDDASKEEMMLRTSSSPDLTKPDLRLSPGDLSHGVGRATTSTTIPPRKKMTSNDAVTVGIDRVNAGFSSGAEYSTSHLGSETNQAPLGRARPSTHYQTRTLSPPHAESQ